MRTIHTLWLAVLVFTIPFRVAADPQRVLFIGNSYTGVNQLPKVFGEIVGSATGAVPTIKSATPGGQTLLQQLGQQPSLALIDEGRWDVVVLQGNSLEAAAAETNEKIGTDFLESARKLAELVRVKSPGAKIYLYETWARHADFWKSSQRAPNVGKDPAEMQARIRKWYAKAAESAKAEAVVPVGDAWELNYQNSGALRLHAQDNSHPEFAGTYLAALVFHQSIYHPKESKVSWRGKLTDGQAKYLQEIAAKTVSPAQTQANPPIAQPSR